MKKIIEKIKKIKLSTIIRTILQILAYINQGLALFSSFSFAKDPVYQWISFGCTIAITVISYWYNNDWTKLAQMAGSVFDMLKDGKITKEELDDFMNKYKSTNTDSTKKVDDKSEGNAEKK